MFCTLYFAKDKQKSKKRAIGFDSYVEPIYVFMRQGKPKAYLVVNISSVEILSNLYEL